MTTLTKDEKQKSLAGGKRKREKAPKIALCNPFPKYWPLAKEEDLSEIEKLMKSLLVREKEKPKLPWKELIRLPKEARKQRINELNKKNMPSEKLSLQRKCIKIGLNAVSRAIQHSRISSCLIAADVEPVMIVNHLVTLALTRGVPLLIFPTLKWLTYQTIGFSCITIGIIVNETDQYFKALNDAVLRIYFKYPLPPNYASFLRRKERSVAEKVPHTKRRIARANQNVEHDPCCNTNTSTFDNISNNMSGDFISFETSEIKDPMQIVRDRPKIDLMSYLPPNFKRVPNNRNKLKKKKKSKRCDF